MASKNGIVVSSNEVGESSSSSSTTSVVHEIMEEKDGAQRQQQQNESSHRHEHETFGTGCLECKQDNDHANILLCERCNAEYHTYCLDPPLRAVPIGDWYCDKCISWTEIMGEDDGLDELVNALSPEYTSRFGEICWAQGGTGFGWWPSFIYDPRLTVGSARQLARKNLGKRHLVYFFECHDAPFAVLPKTKIINWYDGLIDDYHLGKAAKSCGKQRTILFLQAMQAANVELGKPIEMRLDFNHHTEQAQIVPSPKQSKLLLAANDKSKSTKAENDSSAATKTKRKNANGTKKRSRKEEASSEAAAAAKGTTTEQPPKRRGPGRPRKKRPPSPSQQQQKATSSATPIESSEDSNLFCKLLKGGGGSDDHPANIGFIQLKSQRTSTFADARATIVRDLLPDDFIMGTSWKFYIPTLGPVSLKQETSLGPILNFMKQTTTDIDALGDGSVRRPLSVYIVDGTDCSSSQEQENDGSANPKQSATTTARRSPRNL